MRRLLLISFAGSALALFPACSLTGFGSDTGAPAKFAATPSGKHRVLTSNQLGFFNAAGNIDSYTQGAEFHKPDCNDADDHCVTPQQGAVKVIRAYRVTLAQADHGGFDSGYAQVNLSEPFEKGSNLVLTHETTDTNHDGYISGKPNVACGMTNAIAFFGAMPPSAFFQDNVTCIHPVGNFSSGSTESTGNGGHLNLVENDNQEEAYENSAFDQLPFNARVDLMNSVNTKSDIRSEGSSEIVKVSITGLRVGDQTYSPQNVTAEVVNMTNVRVDPANTGLKLAVGWVADRAAEQLKAGAKSLDGSITINGAVTLTLNQLLGQNKSTGLNQSVVDALRAFASGGSGLNAK